MGNSRGELKFLFFLIFFLFLDFLRPLNFYFSGEILLLGIIFAAIYLSKDWSITLAISMGLLKDMFFTQHFPFYTVTFVLVTLSLQYVFKHFRLELWLKLGTIAGVIVLYALANFLVIGNFSSLFILFFCLQSLVAYCILERFLKRVL